MYKFLSGDLSEGKIPMTREAFLSTKEGRELWDNADDIEKHNIDVAIKRNAVQQNKVDPVTSARQREYWRGLAETNPMEFLDKVGDYPSKLIGTMTQPDFNYVRGLYERKKGKPDSDPRVTQAERWLHDAFGNTLVTLGVDRKKKDENEEDYYSFRAGILTAIEDWQAANPGKKLTQKEFNEKLAPEILKYKPGSWFYPEFWKYEEQPFWKGGTKIPEEWEKRTRQEISIDTGIPPEEIKKEIIERKYFHYIYRQSLESAAKKKQEEEKKPPTKKGPQVPSSGAEE